VIRVYDDAGNVIETREQVQRAIGIASTYGVGSVSTTVCTALLVPFTVLCATFLAVLTVLFATFLAVRTGPA
jgi:hypothetical protein